jgi:hypothetical protein
MEFPQRRKGDWGRLATNSIDGLFGWLAYLSGTAEGEITASATSFIVIRRSMAAR